MISLEIKGRLSNFLIECNIIKAVVVFIDRCAAKTLKDGERGRTIHYKEPHSAFCNCWTVILKAFHKCNTLRDVSNAVELNITSNIVLVMCLNITSAYIIDKAQSSANPVGQFSSRPDTWGHPIEKSIVLFSACNFCSGHLLDAPKLD